MANDLLIAILAAGASRRLGRPKQLLTICDEPLIHRQCGIAIQSGLGPVAALLGCGFHACAAAIADLQVAVHHNTHWEKGMGTSIRMAAQAAQNLGATGLMILQVDQYRITAEDLRALHANWRSSGERCACRAMHKDYLGPPVILPASTFAAAANLADDEGARGIFAKLPAELRMDVPMKNAVDDLDTPEQLARAGLGSYQ